MTTYVLYCGVLITFEEYKEILVWEDSKKFNIPYYMGIDSFLKEYKNAVYSCLTNLQ